LRRSATLLLGHHAGDQRQNNKQQNVCSFHKIFTPSDFVGRCEPCSPVT
jgi:hypothetical protein